MASRSESVRRIALGVAVTTALAISVVAWQSTLLGEYSVMDMGASLDEHAAHGHGSTPAGPAHEVSVTSLIADPARAADVRVELVARAETIEIPGGRSVEGYTVNGSSPGPVIRAVVFDLATISSGMACIVPK